MNTLLAQLCQEYVFNIKPNFNLCIKKKMYRLERVDNKDIKQTGARTSSRSHPIVTSSSFGEIRRLKNLLIFLQVHKHMLTPKLHGMTTTGKE